jgi:hypothetical protein
MNRRGFFGWLTAAVGAMVGLRPQGNCFLGYSGQVIDMHKPNVGRFASKEAAIAAGAKCIGEYPPIAWTATDLTNVGCVCLTVLESNQLTIGTLATPPSKPVLTRVWLGYHGNFASVNEWRRLNARRS